MENLESLVTKAKQDPQAFGRLFDLYYPKILNYAFFRTKNLADAQDIAAEVFLKVVKSFSRFTWQRGGFEPWLYRIGANEIKQHWRRQKPQLSLDDLHTAGFDPADRLDLVKELEQEQERIAQNRQISKILELLDSLDHKYREVMIMRFIDGLPIEEIAQNTGKKINTVKSLLLRGRKILSKLSKRILDATN